MPKNFKSLFDLYENSDKFSLEIMFYDFKSKYVMNYFEINENVKAITETLMSISFSNKVVMCLLKPCLMLPSIILGILSVPLAFAFLDLKNPISSFQNLQKFVPHGTLLVEDDLLKDLKNLCSCWKKKISKVLNNFSFSILQSSSCVNEFCPESGRKNVNFSMSVPIAYIMQTSGTTGEPKIVQVPHQCILPNIIDLKSRFGVTHDDVILLCSPLTFDPSIIDIFLFIASGCKLVIVPDIIKSIPKKIKEVIVESKVTIIQGTPSFITSLGEEFIQKSLLHKESSLKVLAFGGEICPSIKKLQRWISKGNKTSLFNLYGLTEVSCWSTCYKINQLESLSIPEIPIGEPLLETLIECDDSGELHVGSETRWCIINDESECDFDCKKALLRPTGDVILKTNDGTLYFEGRKDKIIKFQGKKISFQPLYIILDDDPDITNYYLHFEESSSKLLLFIVFSQEVCELIIKKKRYELFLKFKKYYDKIPPLELFAVPSVPVTPHGKANYKKLLQLSFSKFQITASCIPTKENCAEIISKMWKEYAHQHVSESSNFVMSGGDSVSALQLASDIEWEFQMSIPNLVDCLLNSSFKSVVDLIHSYVCFRENSTVQSYDTSLNDITSMPPKRLSTNNTSVKNQCFQTFSRQRCLLKCVCFDNNHFNKFKPMQKKDSYETTFSLNMLFKIDLKKCIDAAPCVTHYFESGKTVAFIGSHSGIFCCINMTELKKEWETVLPDRIESSACLSSCGNFVFVGCYDYHLYCFCSKQGNILWKFETGAEIKSSPIVSKQNIIFVGSHDKHLYAIKSTGEIVWKNKLSNGSIFSSPELCEEQKGVCAASLDGAISFYNMDSGAIIWSFCYEKPLFSSPKIISSMIYIGSTDGYMLGFNFCGALQSKFKTDGPVFSSVSSSLTPDMGIIFGCHDCCIYCIDKQAELMWKFQCNSPIYATPFPFFWKDSYYVVIASTAGMLYILEANNGKLITSFKCPGEIFSSPIVCGNSLVIGCRDDYAYCFELKNSNF